MRQYEVYKLRKITLYKSFSLALLLMALVPANVSRANTEAEDTTIKPAKLRGGIFGRMVMRCSGGDFSQACFRHFMQAKGSGMQLTEQVFSDIVSNAVAIEDTRRDVVLADGSKGAVVAVSLYRSEVYAKALGKALLFYDAEGCPVGFYDTYDFNPKRFGSRPLRYELMTRGARIFGKLYGGRSFNVMYGKHYFSQTEVRQVVGHIQ